MTQHTDVAGPSGYGPKVTVRRSCSDCKACNSESYAVQGDSGHYVYCEHPSLPERKYIGDTRWDTPGWCPAAAPTTQPSPVAQGDARSMLRIVADYSDWLDSKGRLTSFSTFVDEFGYEERDCKSVYEIVVVPCLAARAAQEGNKP